MLLRIRRPHVLSAWQSGAFAAFQFYPVLACRHESLRYDSRNLKIGTPSRPGKKSIARFTAVGLAARSGSSNVLTRPGNLLDSSPFPDTIHDRGEAPDATRSSFWNLDRHRLSHRIFAGVAGPNRCLRFPGTPVVPARRLLRNLPAQLYGQQRRRHRRPEWDHLETRLPENPRHRRHLDRTVLPVAAGGFRL